MADVSLADFNNFAASMRQRLEEVKDDLAERITRVEAHQQTSSSGALSSAEERGRMKQRQDDLDKRVGGLEFRMWWIVTGVIAVSGGLLVWALKELVLHLLAR